MAKNKAKNTVNTEVSVENKIRAHSSKKDGTAKNEIKDKPVEPFKYMGLPQNNSFVRNPITNDKLPSDYAVKEAKDWVDYNIK
ncbi:MAG: DUF3787 domain-containing protein [Ruminococcaceae bacterium]|nr:DUF3787 domain-containing protein [Oscillospiraceae bacterium]